MLLIIGFDFLLYVTEVDSLEFIEYLANAEANYDYESDTHSSDMKFCCVRACAGCVDCSLALTQVIKLEFGCQYENEF